MAEHLSPARRIREERAARNRNALEGLRAFMAISLESAPVEGPNLQQTTPSAHRTTDEIVGFRPEDFEALRESQERYAACRIAAITGPRRIYD